MEVSDCCELSLQPPEILGLGVAERDLSKEVKVLGLDGCVFL